LLRSLNAICLSRSSPFVNIILEPKKELDKFEVIDDDLLNIILGKPSKDITFDELSKHGFLNLHVTATCLNQQKVLTADSQTIKFKL